MIIIFFLYGLSFFLLGFALFLYPRKDSGIYLSRTLWMAGAFGILHGANEWVDMFIRMNRPAVVPALEYAGLVLLPVSFLFLFLFGIENLRQRTTQHAGMLRTLAIVPVVLWAAATFTSSDPRLMGDVFARYLIAVPAVCLAALAVFREVSEIQLEHAEEAKKNALLTSAAFLVYGLFAGLIVPTADFFPASVINYSSFTAWTGVPVQVFRALCAAAIAWGMIRMLDLFSLEAAAALRESQARYRTIVENSNDLIMLTGPDSTIVYLSPACESVLGHAPEDLTGKQEWIIHPEDCEMAKKMHSEALLGMRGSNLEYRIITKNEEVKWVSHSWAPIERSGRLHLIVSIIRDVTERKKAQEALQKAYEEMEGQVQVRTAEYLRANEQLQREMAERKKMEAELIRTEKLESLGVLAGGLAHDFNNLLAAIMGNLSLSKLYAENDPRLLERLDQAEKASIRARDLTHQLLTFARGGAPVKRSISIREILGDSVCFALRGSNVRCETVIPDDLWPVHADEGQISQVINNLVINANQAMPGGGTIRLTCENVTLAAGQVSTIGKGRYVSISVKDEGVGIEPENLRRIFEPFFTTKRQGSGLGLATSYSIVKNHGGAIIVESMPGKGAHFRVYLPASPDVPDAAVRDAAVVLQGAGRVLIMDDEEIVRDSARAMLGHLGYETATAADGSEALSLYQRAQQEGRPFAAVLMDLTIPGGMGGKEAVGMLRELDPQARVIVSSGYSDDPVMADFRSHGFAGVVVKPYRVNELGEVLRRCIEQG